MLFNKFIFEKLIWSNHSSIMQLTAATHNLDELLNQTLSPIHPSSLTTHTSPPPQPPSSFSSTPMQPFPPISTPYNPYSTSPTNYPLPVFNQTIPLLYPQTYQPTFSPTYPQNPFPIEEIRVEKLNGALGLSIVGGVGHTSQPFGTGQGGIFISKVN